MIIEDSDIVLLAHTHYLSTVFRRFRNEILGRWIRGNFENLASDARLLILAVRENRRFSKVARINVNELYDLNYGDFRVMGERVRQC